MGQPPPHRFYSITHPRYSSRLSSLSFLIRCGSKVPRKDANGNLTKAYLKQEKAKLKKILKNKVRPTRVRGSFV